MDRCDHCGKYVWFFQKSIELSGLGPHSRPYVYHGACREIRDLKLELDKLAKERDDWEEAHTDAEFRVQALQLEVDGWKMGAGQTISGLESELTTLREDVTSVCAEIEAEIRRRPGHPNMGKRGCVKRLKKVLGDETPIRVT